MIYTPKKSPILFLLCVKAPFSHSLEFEKVDSDQIKKEILIKKEKYTPPLKETRLKGLLTKSGDGVISRQC